MGTWQWVDWMRLIFSYHKCLSEWVQRDISDDQNQVRLNVWISRPKVVPTPQQIIVLHEAHKNIHTFQGGKWFNHSQIHWFPNWHILNSVNFASYCSDVARASWPFNAPATRLLVQHLVHADNKENIKAPHYSLSMTGGDISHHKRPVMQNPFPRHDDTSFIYHRDTIDLCFVVGCWSQKWKFE